jgi:hypothetical protein
MIWRLGFLLVPAVTVPLRNESATIFKAILFIALVACSFAVPSLVSAALGRRPPDLYDDMPPM